MDSANWSRLRYLTIDTKTGRERKVSMETGVLGPSVRVDALTTGNVGLKGPRPLKWTVCFRFPHFPRS